jgi:glycosyltransferase involved in cell wall biosynthesis
MRHPMFNIPLLWIQNRKFLYDRLTKFNPTILHCLCDSKLKLTKQIAEQFSIPYVASFNSTQTGLFKHSVSFDHCGAMLASSQTVVDHLDNRYKNMNERIEQVNVGIFVDDKCACFSVPDRITSLVTVKDLDSVAHYEPLLSAIRHLAIDGYEFVYAIIGEGPAEKDIHGLIKALGLNQVVTVVPRIDPIEAVFSSADIYIDPFSSKRFNTYLLEAMGAGMAVAASQDTIEDILVDDQTAVLFDRTDELAIYTTLQKLLDKKEFAKQIALQAQQRLEKGHSVSKMVETFIDIYKKTQQWYTINKQIIAE